jgi:predicted Zn-dependent peptidase
MPRRDVDRSRLPLLGPDVPLAFPEIRVHALDNGIRVRTIEHRSVPLISILVLMPVGSAADPADRPGLAAITGDLLDEGSGDLNAIEVHEALGRIGAQVDTEVGADATLLELTTLDRFATTGAQLLADMVCRPRLETRDFERVRELRLNRLVQIRDMPPAVADRAFTHLLYRDHPYGHLPIGSEDSLRAITLDDVAGFHRRAYEPATTTVIAVGNASHAELASLVAGALGSWRAASPAGSRPVDATAAAPPPPPSERLAIVHRAGAAQSELRIGHVAAARDTPDYHALLVLNTILGGQFVSRINMKLREEKGYTYGARTAFDFRRAAGPFVLQASVQSDATADAIKDALNEVSAIRGDRPVTRAELELGRAALTRGYPRSFETGEQVARGAAQLALYGLPDDYFTTFVPTVLALTEEDITRVATTHLDPSRLLTVVVGDRDRIGASLEPLALGNAAQIAV